LAAIVAGAEYERPDDNQSLPGYGEEPLTLYRGLKLTATEI